MRTLSALLYPGAPRTIAPSKLEDAETRKTIRAVRLRSRVVVLWWFDLLLFRDLRSYLPNQWVRSWVPVHLKLLQCCLGSYRSTSVARFNLIADPATSLLGGVCPTHIESLGVCVICLLVHCVLILRL